MIFERIQSGGIADNSYLIGSGSEAGVIDPRRDCQIHIDRARQNGLNIRYIFETHRNEDYVIGSICGLNIANRDESTLGVERIQNPALQIKDKHEFVKHRLAERQERPHYFRQTEICNLEGPPLLGCMMSPPPLTPAEFKRKIDEGAVVVDTSEPAAFGGTHIKGAHDIWLEGLPVFAGWVLSYDRPVLLVLEDRSHLERAVSFLIRAGYDRVVGYVRDGTASWYNAGFPTESLPLLSVHELKSMLDRGEELVVLDVRGQDEWESGHIAGALRIYVGHLEQRVTEVPKGVPIAIVCNAGQRAGLGASILLRAGYPSVYNVLGGVKAWVNAGFPVSTHAGI